MKYRSPVTCSTFDDVCEYRGHLFDLAYDHKENSKEVRLQDRRNRRALAEARREISRCQDRDAILEAMNRHLPIAMLSQGLENDRFRNLSPTTLILTRQDAKLKWKKKIDDAEVVFDCQSLSGPGFVMEVSFKILGTRPVPYLKAISLLGGRIINYAYVGLATGENEKSLHHFRVTLALMGRDFPQMTTVLALSGEIDIA